MSFANTHLCGKLLEKGLNMRKILLFIVVFPVFLALPAQAQMVISGNGAPYACYMKVKTGDSGKSSTIRQCEEALLGTDISVKNEIALKTNIGILHMRAKNYNKARLWYEDALAMAPNEPLIYVNYSACEVYMGDYPKAVTLATRALELGTDKEPEALYNRAIAYDRLDKFTPAYRDLKRALELRPDWAPAVKAIANYDVVTVPKG